MKIKNILFVILMILMFIPVSPVISNALDIQQVGWGPNDIEGIDGPGNPVAPEQAETEDSNDSSGDNPVEYDPDNPYAEWEN